MAITIAEAARQWRVARETIYRRQLADELEFATIDPPTIDASEMLRAFGEPKAASDKPAATDVVALSRIEAICEALKAAAEYLMAELAAMKKELQAEHEQTRKERDRLLEFLGAQKRLLETSETSTSPLPRGETSPLQRGETSPLQRGEMAEAQAVLAAQQRVETHLTK
jgi:hypothetical protein